MQTLIPTKGFPLDGSSISTRALVGSPVNSSEIIRIFHYISSESKNWKAHRRLWKSCSCSITRKRELKMKGKFENSLILTKFILRRDRIASSVWIALVVLLTAGLAVSMQSVLDGASRNEMVKVMANPTFVSFIGSDYVAQYAPDSYGALFANMLLLLIGVAVGILNIFLVVRHTRADEEKGRYEVLRSLPTGRLACMQAV